MGIPIPELDNFPITPAKSLALFKAMREMLLQHARIIADNFQPNPIKKTYPWVSLRMIRLTGYAKGSSWFNARLQEKTPRVVFDPTQDLKMKNLYQDIHDNDDCYVFDFAANGIPGGLHRLKMDGSVYVLGWFQDYSGTDTTNGTQDNPAPRLPVFSAVSIPTSILLPCTLTNPSGSAGANNPPTAASLVYDLHDMDGTLIQAATPLWTARQMGHVTPATKGIYFSDYNNNWRLVWTDEVIDAGECS